VPVTLSHRTIGQQVKVRIVLYISHISVFSDNCSDRDPDRQRPLQLPALVLAFRINLNLSTKGHILSARY
jgi:hypothetical protein